VLKPTWLKKGVRKEKLMKISIFLPEKTFNKEQLSKLKKHGDVVFSPTGKAMQVEDCIKLAKGSDVIGFDPDNFGGFDLARDRLT
jgi:hypothetical protein